VIVSSYIPDSLDLAFEFDLAEAILLGIEAGTAAGVSPVMERIQEVYPPGQYAAFLSNHDQVRVMSRLFTPDRARAAAVLLLTTPGVPFLYYGEEIGMKGTKPDPRLRTPLPWDPEGPGFGFTEAAEPWQPFQAGAEEVNVSVQSTDPDSLLAVYRTLVHFRNGSPALRYGDFLPVDTGRGSVYAYIRSVGSDSVLVVVNLGRTAVTSLELNLAEGPLEGITGTLTVIGPDAETPNVTAAGGFHSYRPVPGLDPYGVLVVQFTTGS
jgi:glycosidase